MIQLRPNENLFLIGFMAAGKTTIGAGLAQKLDRSFIDTDGVIVETYGKPIAEIFSRKGELYFRELETRILEDIVNQTGCVIALGGGTLESAGNRSLVKSSGKRIYLRWRFENLLRRLHGNGRPLVLIKDEYELQDLFKSRRRYYETADLILDCESYGNPDEIIEQITNQIEIDQDEKYPYSKRT